MGRDEYAASAVPRCEHIEQQLATSAIERDEPNFIEDNQVDALQTTHRAIQLLLVASLDQRTHQVGGAPEDNAPSLSRRFDAERDRQMRLARADGTGEEDILAARDPQPMSPKARTKAYRRFMRTSSYARLCATVGRAQWI